MRNTIIALALLFLISAARAQPKVTLVAGGGDAGDGALARDAKVAQPFGVEFDSRGNLLVIEYTGRLRSIAPDGRISTLGGGAKGDQGDGGPAKDALFNAPHAIAVGADGGVYVADTLNHRVRRIDPATGIVTSVAGSTKGYSGDGGPAVKAQFSGIYCVTFNPDRSKLVITDLDNRRIRVMDMKTGVVALAAGNGSRGVPVDGAAATQAPLVDPRAAAMDSKGSIYILERGGHALRVIDPQGKIRTLIPGPAKKGDPRVIAGPKHLVIDSKDNPIIADTDNHRIIRWNAQAGLIEPLAGTGKAGKTDPAAPQETQLNQPHGVYLDREGNLYIADSLNNRVLKIEGK